jgi:RNA polymerase primary sigma factor
MRDFKISVRITDTSQNLSRYFSDITKEKMLDPQVEADLAMRAKEGDVKARERIILANLRFVISVAKAYAGKNAPLEDLISEGNKGLIEAMEVFDPTAGFKFISYAVWHIRKNIFLYLSNNSRVFRIPGNVANELKRYQSMEDFFIGQNGREPSVDEILLFWKIMELNR